MLNVSFLKPQTTIIAALTGLLAITACGVPTAVKPVQVSQHNIQVAEAAVREVLKDPYSAQFRSPKEYKVTNGDNIMCGKVNGKNSFGGYTGYKTYYVRMLGTQIKRTFIDNSNDSTATMGCQQAASGTVRLSQ